MSDSNLVRVRVAGQETNVSRAWAEKRNLEILDEPTHRLDGTVRRPTRKGGRPLKPRVTLPSAGTTQPPVPPADEPVPYAEQTAGELQALVEARNDARSDDEPQISVDEPGEHEQLVQALEYDDEFLALLQSHNGQ